MEHAVLVIGAGMTGLTAARALVGHGIDVLVFDKGRAVGGRMATRRWKGAVFDHGAQHFSVRTPEFAHVVDGLVERGVADVWLQTRSWTHRERGVENRYVGVGGIRRIPEALTAGLTVRTGVLVDAIELGPGEVTVVSRGERVASGSAAIVTAPLPQSLRLLNDAGCAVGPDVGALHAAGYDATLAVMAVLDRPSGIESGHRADASGAIAWLADNQHKGASPIPALTIHSSARFAASRLAAAPDEWAAELIAIARPLHDGVVVHHRTHRWLYAAPRETSTVGAVSVPAPAPLVLAGEIFAEARVEGAFTSGRVAAETLLAMLD
jgi:renalase